MASLWTAVVLRRRAGVFAASQAPTLAADLLEAIVAYLSADAGMSAAFPGGFSSDQDAPGGTFPYLLIVEDSVGHEYESAHPDGTPAGLDRPELSIAIYALDKSLARALRHQVWAFMTDPPLAFANGTLLHLRPADHAGAEDPDPAPGGDPVWSETITFDCLVGR